MLTKFRSHLDSWFVRALFFLLVIAFAVWGVGDVIRLVGTDSSVASVAGRKLDAPTVQRAFQRQLQATERQLGDKAAPNAALRRQIALQTVEILIAQTAMNVAAENLGVVVPDAALRQAIYAIPAFQGPAGSFDRRQFEMVLQKNGLDEGQFFDMVRGDLREQEILGALRAGVAPPEMLVRALFTFQDQTRVADAVELPFNAAPPPPAPTDAELKRYWENHPGDFSAPEYRRIKAVVLSPETIAKSITIPEDELHLAYDQRKAEFSKPESRAIEVVVARSEAAANKLATAWRGGASWAEMDKAAQQAGESTLALDAATPAQIPVPELAKAIFAASPGVITGPIKTDLAWYVVRVNKINPPSSQDFAAVKEQLRADLARQKAAEQIDDRATKLEDALAGSGGLDEIPSDLGAIGVAGTLDAEGATPEGQPAPLPGPEALDKALIATAFQMKKGDPPHVTEVDLPSAEGAPAGRAYFAVSVAEVIPPAVKPFAAVKPDVTRAWIEAAERHAQEVAAAGLLTAVKGGESLADAALKAGLRVRRLPAVKRNAGAEGVPASLIAPLFAIQKGEPTMVETKDSFVVAVLAEINDPDAKTMPLDYGKIRDVLTQRIGNDIEQIYVNAVRERGHPRVNEALLGQIAAP
jgi:peptidyl-prolyl cis-trans isomerase D